MYTVSLCIDSEHTKREQLCVLFDHLQFYRECCNRLFTHSLFLLVVVVVVAVWLAHYPSLGFHSVIMDHMDSIVNPH